VIAVLKVVHLFYLCNIYFYKYEVVLLFAAIGNAAAILTDPEKRKQYDMYGSEEERIQQSQRHAHGSYRENSYTRGFEGNS
jgi:DnaJ-class molecular chaperone